MGQPAAASARWRRQEPARGRASFASYFFILVLVKKGQRLLVVAFDLVQRFFYAVTKCFPSAFTGGLKLIQFLARFFKMLFRRLDALVKLLPGFGAARFGA